MVQYKTFGPKHYIVFVKKRPATGQITFWLTPLKVVQSCSTLGMWGVYPEVLRAHARKSPFFLSCFDRLRKVLKPYLKRQFLKLWQFNSFWDFSLKRSKQDKKKCDFWACVCAQYLWIDTPQAYGRTTVKFCILMGWVKNNLGRGDLKGKIFKKS